MTSPSAPCCSSASAPSRDAFDDLDLVRLLAEQLQRLVPFELDAFEALVGFDDGLHLGLDALDVFGREGAFDVEVVIEAVIDRRADRVLGPGEQSQYRLCEHVRA